MRKENLSIFLSHLKPHSFAAQQPKQIGSTPVAVSDLPCRPARRFSAGLHLLGFVLACLLVAFTLLVGASLDVVDGVAR